MGDSQSQRSATPDARGTRPVRIANCSGARGDPGYQMLRQATLGPVDFITGDYLAEMTLAENVEKMAQGLHEGWEVTAWEGLEQSLEAINERRIKVAINGGAQNPKGLAQKVQRFANDKGLNLKVAYVYGDNFLEEVKSSLEKNKQLPKHLDSGNPAVKFADNIDDVLDTKEKPVLSANAYLGARAIVKALELGADIVICGRVADASPVIAAAWYWHGWSETDYDRLAGSLIAGHLIECSAYVTGSNFSGFSEYPLDTFVDLSFGIAEIAADGTTVIRKHEGTNGVVNVDTCRCQFLYELQGNVYLNSDVTADATSLCIEQVGKDRVKLSNVKGYPPPPTTKLAIIYHGGYEGQILSNATGYATNEKWALFEKQLRNDLKTKGLLDKYQLLDFQVLGTPALDPRSQFSSTTYGRWFIQADTEELVAAVLRAWVHIAMQHFSGFHFSTDMRTALPRPYQAFYPGTISQDEIKEGAVLLAADGSDALREEVKRPSKYHELQLRKNEETTRNPVELSSFGQTRKARLGDVALGRSGDKGANVNFGIFVRRAEHYPWLQTFMTTTRLKELMGDDWKDSYFVERVEFPNLLAVHFVIYGPLGRGVSGCRLLDALGKGFTDFIRDRVVDVPEKFLRDVEDVKAERLALLSS
ncbi:hypothetical protein AJ80_05972 [Polytolypa hystricis UAMH7299]|uniref:DUF1446 domain-containing protein n=1 Tax=Polytolypa hystricis (strain UAMH7299) TaxID=1447883 RepID=A0A2B7Y0J2_POLH7|nr:hypothetical protein AJ80_05972 [Polytolypa hystricis UAMH7299]